VIAIAGKEQEGWVAADPTRLAATRRLAEEAGESYGLDRADRFAFTFAVNEAVSNAIEHGAPSPDGTVQVRFTEGPDALVCSVRDYGQFTARPASVQDEIGTRGRGLAFMASMVDRMDLCRGSTGTLVRLSKRRTPLPCA
jgi:anti-sigma regulatory factor (Ser/Thr protein kinase)